MFHRLFGSLDFLCQEFILGLWLGIAIGMISMFMLLSYLSH